ncbi:uracil-DNA glycosylase [Burkholderiaceae bacterium DAT-1]|nr:uracil-DNA glycosylase [Burkholderiaceae bacterium DAT-1]
MSSRTGFPERCSDIIGAIFKQESAKVDCMKCLPESWKSLLETRVPQTTWSAIEAFLLHEEAAGKIIYPPADQRFSALTLTSPDAVKVVILGQDPYHGEGQAHGLSFSVPKGVRPPPSLQNIFKEIQRDLGYAPPGHGDLSAWARQGVLLLNTVLSVEAGKAGSHQKRGWEDVTDALVRGLSSTHEGIVFMLWGSHAEKKASLIDASKHLILRSPHPSPLSAYRGFIGNGHFSAANRFLVQHQQSDINWKLDSSI